MPVWTFLRALFGFVFWGLVFDDVVVGGVGFGLGGALAVGDGFGFTLGLGFGCGRRANAQQRRKYDTDLLHLLKL
ncbi:MAG TPA: hypothetical protein VGH19_11445 [Verrucomicrobiae bacterium]